MEKEKKSPQPNMLKPKVLYSFTYNPNNDRQYYKYCQEQHYDRIATVCNYVSKLFRRQNLEYLLHMEISTPMQTIQNNKQLKPRIHFHGFIMFRNYAQIYHWYNRGFIDLSEQGYFDMDTTDDPEYYYDYCKKNLDTMMEICKTNKIVQISPIIRSVCADKILRRINQILKKSSVDPPK